MLDTFAAEGKFWRGNLHGHSTGSDGVLSPQDVCDTYRNAGYDFTALTDHFRVNYNFPITDSRPYRTEGFTTLLGAELHAPTTSRDMEWHILTVGLPLDFAPLLPGETGPEIARRARDAGAFVAIAHPQWYHLQLADGRALDAAHAVEIYNHTCHVNATRGESAGFYDAMLLDGHRLSAIAVDDSHWSRKDAFGGWVMVKATENTPEALLIALKAGHFYATQGPRIENIRREGNALQVTCSAAESVTLAGAVRATKTAFGPGLTEATVPLDLFDGSWCRIVVTDEQGRRAWSNPLWLD